ncbi:MAG TPA: DRTGG domain-containing protein [Tepidiformaceae bacterium]
MPTIVVTSNSPGEGKTGVAAAIARHYAYQGRPVRLARVTGGGRALQDAEWFGSLDFVPGSPVSNVVPADIPAPAGAEELIVVEADAEAASALAGDRKIVLVARGSAPAEFSPGITPAVVVVTALPGSANASLPADVSGVPVISLAEDRTLAGFSVSEAKEMLNAEVLVEGDPGDPTCDHLVIAPISSDAGQPYFRRFPTKAVVVRFDKTDMHLAAMQADPQCLILTGGRMPSGYLFDAAGAKGVPVLLSRTDTENTVLALEDLFDNTRFQGERKLDRMAELLGPTALFDTLGI